MCLISIIQQQSLPVMHQPPKINAGKPNQFYEPMNSATQSSVQQLKQYQMQYSSWQQQQAAPEDSLESLLPSINGTGLDSALKLDMETPFGSPPDPKELDKYLIETPVTYDAVDSTSLNRSDILQPNLMGLGATNEFNLEATTSIYSNDDNSRIKWTLVLVVIYQFRLQ